LAAQIQFVRFRFLQNGAIVVPDEHVPAKRRAYGENDRDEEPTHGQRPAADVARIESTELIEKLHSQPPS